MSRWFADYNGLELFYLASAIVGGFFVIVKMIMQFAGGDAETDMDVADGADIDHADSDVGFRFLSIHGLSSFFMMFGLVGLAMYRESHLGALISTGGAVVAGFFAVWAIGKLFFWAARLQSSGTLDIGDAVGSTGKVYLTIPEGGTGRVTINFKNHLREYDAMEINGSKVPTDTPVRVVYVDGSILTVEVIQ